MPHLENVNFSAPPEEHDFAALLFDLDGTIIDSTDAIVKFWHQLGKEIGVDPNYILQTSHGRRTIEVLGIHAPQLANWDYVCHAEGQIPIQYGHDAVEVPGARALLDRLNQATIPWAIVTSGTTPLFSGWLKVLQLARPKTLVSAEHVEKGKPDPACYKLGAKQLGLADVDPSQILVLEDAPAGVRAGKAAGYRVVALATTHRIDQLWEAGADWVVRDMRSVTVASWDAKAQRARIEFRDALLK
ncbi:HAD-like domain-containing protein [Neohortaea acidophila]|uniref:HAD-like domain-containing protein n=1 Tax=Neohortaea acidophila TaxID=245834 RepID=A0A6A6PWN9_9PEZI|nr:HAD-like domain-containing protein [Neohortaea acidophila]KAF2484415.1 HAD-like domain-containing protein [Neohortaea acidophila]